jgi:hypothetical protein
MLHKDFHHCLNDAVELHCILKEHDSKDINIINIMRGYYKDDDYPSYGNGDQYTFYPNLIFHNDENTAYIDASPTSYTIIDRFPDNRAHRFQFGPMYFLFYPETMSFHIKSNDISMVNYFKADREEREVLFTEYMLFKDIT